MTPGDWVGVSAWWQEACLAHINLYHSPRRAVCLLRQMDEEIGNECAMIMNALATIAQRPWATCSSRMKVTERAALFCCVLVAMQWWTHYNSDWVEFPVRPATCVSPDQWQSSIQLIRTCHKTRSYCSTVWLVETVTQQLPLVVVY